MPRITWKCPDGRVVVGEAAPGQNLMEAALAHGVEGIHGDCGGALACATCHVVPEADWAARLGGPGPLEDEMLDMIDGERRPASRLSCQILADEELDGLVLRVPGA